MYATGDKIQAKPKYSKLRAEDVELLPDFEYFMEQEIYAQSESTGKLIKLFQGGSNSGRYMLETINRSGVKEFLSTAMLEIVGTSQMENKQNRFDQLCASKEVEAFIEQAKKAIAQYLM